MPLGRIHVPAAGGYDAGYDDAFASNFDPHLQITVIRTTCQGTVCALQLASAFAKDLSARIRLLSAEVVPFRLPLEHPMISVDFLRWQQLHLVQRAGLDDDEVAIQICLCRDRKKALQDTLSPRSLLVVGGKARWWNGEGRLAKWLESKGHQVLFAHLRNVRFVTTGPLQATRNGQER